LSIPIGSESVSNMMRLAALPASADIAMADMASSKRVLDVFGECFVALALIWAYFHRCFHRLCCTEQWILSGLIHDRSTNNHCPINLPARLRWLFGMYGGGGTHTRSLIMRAVMINIAINQAMAELYMLDHNSPGKTHLPGPSPHS
jgi:hypothetical protein